MRFFTLPARQGECEWPVKVLETDPGQSQRRVPAANLPASSGVPPLFGGKTPKQNVPKDFANVWSLTIYKTETDSSSTLAY